MGKKRYTGVLGLTMPEPPKGATNPKMTHDAIVKWRDNLPMADTGAAAKSMFLMQIDMSKSVIEPEMRFKMLEAIKPQLKSISTTLKKHYIEQHEPLTAQKLKIAELRQTLMGCMADNYKLILNYLLTEDKGRKKELICTTICRILYYYSIFFICRYQLYTYIPSGMWQEIHNLYKYGLENNLLQTNVQDPSSLNNATTNILSSYTRIILLNATDPYQWRQRDQHSLSKVIDLWAMYPMINALSEIRDNKEGLYVIDLEQDVPPVAYNFKDDPITDSCIALDLYKEVKHLRDVLNKMHNNELKARIDHPNDPEFSVTIPTLQKLIGIWSQNMVRSSSRFPLEAKVYISFGLTAAHYYLNNQVEFDPTPENLHIQNHASDKTAQIKQAVKELPTFEVEMEDDDDEDDSKQDNKSSIHQEKSDKKDEEGKSEKESNPVKPKAYKIYQYDVKNISPGGMCLIIHDGSFPPFQAGEVVAFKNPMGDIDSWSIGSLRWMKRNREEKFLLGIQLIAPFAQAAGMQVIRNQRPVGHLLRCIVLPPMPELNKPSTIITPGIPLHANEVMLYMEDQDGVVAKLTKETEATGMYYQYEYSTKTKLSIKKKTAKAKKKEVAEEELTPKKIDTEFDNLWEDL